MIYFITVMALYFAGTIQKKGHAFWGILSILFLFGESIVLAWKAQQAFFHWTLSASPVMGWCVGLSPLVIGIGMILVSSKVPVKWGGSAK